MMIDRFVYFYLLFPITVFSLVEFNLSEEETRLIRILLNESTYLKRVRPSNKVIVDIRFLFNQLISMVEKEQIIVTNCFVDQKWIDPRLIWDPKDFKNISWIRIPATAVWYPDTFLYNTADNAGFLLPQGSQHMIVSFNGTVFWPLPLAQLRTRCRMTIRHFPFDEQACDMIFGSWSHTSSLIHYKFWENKPDLLQYTPNNEWRLLAVTQSIKTVTYPKWVEQDTFYEVNFTILIVRKPLQAIYNTVVPALMLTTLTLVSFFIPFAQEMQIGISIMLAYSVFSLRLSEDIPSQSDNVHLISLYLTVCMFFSLSAMTWFAIVNKLRERKHLPYWLRWLALDYLFWVVFAKSMHRKAVRAAKQEQLKNVPARSTRTIAIPLRQEIARNETDEYKRYCSERGLSLYETSTRLPLLSANTQQQALIDQSTRSIVSGRCNASPINEVVHSTKNSSSSVWVPRRLPNTTLSSSKNECPDQKFSFVSNRSTQSHLNRQPYDYLDTKNQESLYAIHIYNRLVFLMFFITVIIINIYTWFFYSKTVRTKFLDDQSSWFCFDEYRLDFVNCSDMS